MACRWSVAVSASTDTILAPWRSRAIVIASTLGFLALTVAALSWLFSRELQSRYRAESKALQLAEQLAIIATRTG